MATDTLYVYVCTCMWSFEHLETHVCFVQTLRPINPSRILEGGAGLGVGWVYPDIGIYPDIGVYLDVGEYQDIWVYPDILVYPDVYIYMYISTYIYMYKYIHI